jgi:hypothetical protein
VTGGQCPGGGAGGMAEAMKGRGKKKKKKKTIAQTAICVISNFHSMDFHPSKSLWNSLQVLHIELYQKYGSI